MRRHLVAFLGFLCALVMQAQRMNIGIAIVSMVNSTDAESPSSTSECSFLTVSGNSTVVAKGEFPWDPELQGYILSAGFLGYVLSQVPGGVLARRFGAKRILVSGLLSASISHLVSPVAAWKHAYVLVAAQLIRGMGQGLQQPALSVLMSNWFPRTERGFFSTFIYCGYPMGAFITSLTSGPMCDSTFLNGWPMVFYTFGFFGIVVLLLFMFFYSDRPDEDSRISKKELNYILESQENDISKQNIPTPWLAILTSIPTYALVIAIFGMNWMSFYFLTVHPTYMGTVLNIPIKENGMLSSGPHALQAVVGCLACCLSFKLRNRIKTRVGILRKGFNTLSSTVFCVGLLGVYFSGCDTLWNVFFMFVATGSIGFGFGGCLINAVDMSPTFCGPLMGFVSSVSSVSGFLVPVTVGYLTKEEQNLTQWSKMFVLSIGIAAGCGLLFLWLGSSNIQPWDPASEKDSDSPKTTKPHEKLSSNENKKETQSHEIIMSSRL